MTFDAFKNTTKKETIVVTEEFDGTYDLKGITREELQIIYIVLGSANFAETAEKAKEYLDKDGVYYNLIAKGKLDDFNLTVDTLRNKLYTLYGKFQKILEL